MVTVKVVLKSASPYSQCRPIQSKKHQGELDDVFEERSWRERIHQNEKGEVFIPPMALKNCLSEVAKYLSETIPGKGKATYTKHFEAGLLIVDPIMLGVKADKVNGERLFVPADGRRGGGKRVWKTFPVIASWEGEATIYIMDIVLADKSEKVRQYLEYAGKFIGMGRFRPRNNGFYGRFEVVSFEVVA
jgi:hypothetical protein